MRIDEFDITTRHDGKKFTPLSAVTHRGSNMSARVLFKNLLNELM